MNKKITTTIIDNWLEPHLAEFLSNYLYKGVLYRNQKSTIDDETSFLQGVVNCNPLIDFLHFKLKYIMPLNITETYTNLQYPSMNAEWHVDRGDVTFLYMCSKNLNPNEGFFEIKNEIKIQYKFNRLIYFDATKLHKGHPPKQNIPRITLAIKTNKIL